jgi:beta-galactosidase
LKDVVTIVFENSAYTGLLATAGDQAAPTIEKPEYQVSQLGQGKLAESKTSVSTEDQKRLPETGESQSDTAIFLAGVSLALSAAVLATKLKEN